MIFVGELSVWIALLTGVWAVTTSFAGGWLRRDDLILSGERGLYICAGFVGVASIGLWTALLTSDFSLRYVASFTNSNLPLIYKFSAFWAGHAGSMLFWSLVFALYVALATWTNRSKHRELMPWVTGTNAAVLLFFVAATALTANPFERLDWVPRDGRGLDPQLQDLAIVLRPPALYLGYVATAVPFSFAVAALVTRRLDAEWLSAVRKWSLASWILLTVGILLGMWWAYVELGTSRYWMWDPVENASLLPWLTATALLHSIRIQEERGMLRKWNVVLVIATFLLSVVGTFIMRSGVLESAHPFPQSGIGNWLAWFFVLALGVSVWLVLIRLDDLESNAEFEAVISRESVLHASNLVLIGIAFTVLWGTFFPILSERIWGTRSAVGESFFNAVNVPLGLLLLALAGIGPLIAWRRDTVANLRRELAFPALLGILTGAVLVVLGVRDLTPLVAWSLCGFVSGTILRGFSQGVLVHAGIVMLFVAFAGTAFKQEHRVTLVDGQTFTTTDPFGREWSFTSEGISAFRALNRDVVTIAIRPVVEGKSMPVLTSEARQYFNARGADTFEPSTEVGILHTLRQDVYLVLVGTIGDRAVVRIDFNPLVMWVWFGGTLTALGGLIVMWRGPRRSPSARRGEPVQRQ